MNLVVDSGFSILKAALAQDTTLGKTFRYQGEYPVDYVVSIAQKYLPSTIVICSSRPLSKEDIEKLDDCCDKLLIMDSQHKEIQRQASLPEYLSADCAASIIAAGHLFKGKSCNIFDFGTIIKSSFIDAEGHYLGGNISPGCTTRFRSINRYSKHNLPMVSESDDIQKIGNSLASSIRSGVVSGIMFEIEGYMSLYPGSMSVFTGGDANYFAKRTKNSIFVVCNLVLMGLSLIAIQNEGVD